MPRGSPIRIPAIPLRVPLRPPSPDGDNGRCHPPGDRHQTLPCGFEVTGNKAHRLRDRAEAIL